MRPSTSVTCDGCRPPGLLRRPKDSSEYWSSCRLVRSPQPAGKQSGRFIEVQVGDQQPFCAVRLVAQQRTIRTRDRRSRRGARAGIIHAGEVTGIFGGAAQNGFLVEAVVGVGECGWAVTARLGGVEMRVKDDLRAVTRGPSDRFWIAPTFVTDRDPERERAGPENAPSATRGVRAFFGRIDLHLILKAGQVTVILDNGGGGEQRSILCDALGPKDYRYTAVFCRMSDFGPG